MNDLDVVDQKRLLEATAGACAAPAPARAALAAGPDAAFGPGVYDVCDLAELPNRTRLGWQLVRLVEQTRAEPRRRDVAAPPEVASRQLNPDGCYYGNGTGRISQATDGYMPLAERGTITLWEQVSVTVTVALIFLDTSSAIAQAETARAQAVASMLLAQEEASTAKAAAELATKNENNARVSLTTQRERSEQLVAERTALREKTTRMENDLAKLRREKDKLVDAVGKIKAAEILGE